MFLAIGKLLTKEAEKEGIDVTYGFPNKPAHSGHPKYGWFDVCKVPLLIKPINMNKIVNFLDERKRISFLNRYKISRIVRARHVRHTSVNGWVMLSDIPGNLNDMQQDLEKKDEYK